MAPDAVFRSHLCQRLEEGRHFPLTLVSAPAGFGKTTLLGQWLESGDEPSTWLSLDETDNEPRVFLSYFVAAVRSVFPDACPGTFAYLKLGELPPVEVMAGQLINDLDSIPEHFVLALDDYHRIRHPAIHQILSGLLAHPPKPLHLAIMSRRDPPIPIASLRGRHMMTEVRARDLQFTRGETGSFLARATGKELGEPAVYLLHSGTEGWPVGLRLAASALRHREDVEGFVKGFGGGTAQIQHYLVEEILSHQPPEVAACLCETSILDRFCAPLVEAVCSHGRTGRGNDVDGLDFIRVLKDTSLPCIALDDQGQWYRHHHLFQELLRRHLETIHEPEEVAQLHRRAAAWFEEKGSLEEALEHLLRLDDAGEAGRLIRRHGREIKEKEQWHRLVNLITRLPSHLLEGDVDLQLLSAWTLDNRLRRPEAWAIVDRVEGMLERPAAKPDDRTRAQGEIHALRSCQRLEEAEGILAVEHAERALAMLPPECLSERGYSMITLALGLQVSGQADRAYRAAYDALGMEKVSTGIYRARLLSSLAWIQWLEGDLQQLKVSAQEYLTQGRTRGLPQSIHAGLTFLGAAHYQLNELGKAEEALAPLVSDPVLNATSQVFLQGGFALASTLQAAGKADRAMEIAERIEEGMSRIRNTALLEHTRGFRADLALRQGRLAEAFRWAESYDPRPFGLIYRFYAPEITLAKVLLAEGSAASQRRAMVYLDSLDAFLSRTHNRLFSIPVLALQALLLSRQGEEPAAVGRLERAVAFARPGGAVRVFADLDPEVGRMLARLPVGEDVMLYLSGVQAAFDTKDTAAAAARHRKGWEGSGPLTSREVQILRLLAQRLSNKEIAQSINLAPGTVKRHTENIYGKLGVHGRRDAVAKATGLGLLREHP